MIGHGPSSEATITLDQLLARVRWHDLLLSGKYRQTREKLATPTGIRRCCLGVACDEAVVPGLYAETGNREMRFDEEGDLLPRRALEALGMRSKSPSVYIEGSLRHLSSLNDGEGRSFQYIAAAIWENYIQPYVEDGTLNEDGAVAL